MEVFLFPKVVPNLWNVDGEVTVPEQKPGEVAEELASSYERKLIEVRLMALMCICDVGCLEDFSDTVLVCQTDVSKTTSGHCPTSKQNVKW